LKLLDANQNPGRLGRPMKGKRKMKIQFDTANGVYGVLDFHECAIFIEHLTLSDLKNAVDDTIYASEIDEDMIELIEMEYGIDNQTSL